MFIDAGFPYCRKKLYTRLKYLMQTKAKNEEAFKYKYIDIGEVD
jgi:hypothetical protein